MTKKMFSNKVFLRFLFGCIIAIFCFTQTFAAQETKVEREITTCRDLESIGKGENYPGATHEDAWSTADDYVINQTIDCTETADPKSQYGPNGFDSIVSYTGQFNGNLNKIIGLTGTNSSGLFKTISQPGKVKNLMLEDINISGLDDVGGLVGNISTAEITNIFVSGKISGKSRVGGLVGDVYGSVEEPSVVKITNIASHADVQGYEQVGGIAGQLKQTLIENAYSTGTIKGDNHVGGISGTHIGGGYEATNQGMKKVFATGYIFGEANIAGIVGEIIEYPTIDSALATAIIKLDRSMGKTSSNDESKINKMSPPAYSIHGPILSYGSFGEISNYANYHMICTSTELCNQRQININYEQINNIDWYRNFGYTEDIFILEDGMYPRFSFDPIMNATIVKFNTESSSIQYLPGKKVESPNGFIYEALKITDAGPNAKLPEKDSDTWKKLNGKSTGEMFDPELKYHVGDRVYYNYRTYEAQEEVVGIAPPNAPWVEIINPH